MSIMDCHEKCENENDNYKEALFAIADELKKFNGSLVGVPAITAKKSSSDEVFDKLSLLHLNLQKKDIFINKLKSNIHYVIDLAKSVLHKKQIETESLNSKLINARSEAILKGTLNENQDETIQNFITENKSLKNEIKNYRQIIEYAFVQLLKMRKQDYEDFKDLPPTLQLKEIITSCGQYYAEYYNEQHKISQLEQRNHYLNNKNTYLSNKLNIVEKSLEHSTCELEKLQNELNFLKNNKIPKSFVNKIEKQDSNIKFSCSEYIMAHCDGYPVFRNPPSSCNRTSVRSTDSYDFDIISQIALVKSLLQHQAECFQNLRVLSEESNIISL